MCLSYLFPIHLMFYVSLMWTNITEMFCVYFGLRVKYMTVLELNFLAAFDKYLKKSY